MRMKKLGNTGLLVSELCLGTMTFGNSGGMFAQIGQLQQSEVDGIVRGAIDAASTSSTPRTSTTPDSPKS